MLFNLFNCVAPSALGAGSFAAGGACFVAAIIATLAASGRAQPAKSLRGEVPVVERLAVRIVTDNVVIQFVPAEKRDGLSIERKSGNTHPDKPPRTVLNGEWGLAMFVESKRGDETRHLLIDFGYTPEVLLNNMEILQVDPSLIDAMVLSHGHYDHFGGMVGFLQANKGRLKKKLPFYVGGEDCFCIRRNPAASSARSTARLSSTRTFR